MVIYNFIQLFFRHSLRTFALAAAQQRRQPHPACAGYFGLFFVDRLDDECGGLGVVLHSISGVSFSNFCNSLDLVSSGGFVVRPASAAP
jgi:hypothetical protein